MPYIFKLPDIGEGTVEAEIIRWLVKEGEKVKADQPIAEVMTEKVNIEIASPKNGTIHKILAKEGEKIRVGQPIISILEEGEQPPEQQPQYITQQTQISSQPTTTQKPMEILATPAVRRLARELGVDITKVKGTGPSGRITEEDVRQYAQSIETPKPQPAEQITITREQQVERIPYRGMRRQIGEHMKQAIKNIPHAVHFEEIDVTELVSIREKLKEALSAQNIKLTYLPFIIKAVIQALKKYPIFNATLDEEKNEIVIKKYYNIGIATATQEGLVVPVIKNADKKNIIELAKEIETLTEKARNKKLELNDVRDSTFSITNIGSIGGILSVPIINYPEAAILGIHRILEKPVIKDDKLITRKIMYLSLSFDHRIIDGAMAAEFVNTIKEYLEQPYLLFIT
ncbi:MAG: dihydrolipoamide acetyltransferase family protein [Thermoprotei archaeon]